MQRSSSFAVNSFAILSWILLFIAAALPGRAQLNLAEDLSGKSVDPFKASVNRTVVLLFVRTDCPISNRYAPTIQKLAEKFQGQASFWLVYPDADETAAGIREHIEQFHYAIPALRDVHHTLVKRDGATIHQESDVVDAARQLKNLCSIDDYDDTFITLTLQT